MPISDEEQEITRLSEEIPTGQGPTLGRVLILLAILLLYALAIAFPTPLMQYGILLIVFAIFILERYLASYVDEKLHMPKGLGDPMLILKLALASFLWIFLNQPLIAVPVIIAFLFVTLFTPSLAQWWHKSVRKGRAPAEQQGKKGYGRIYAALILAIILDVLDYLGLAIPVLGDVVDVIANIIFLPLIGKYSLLGWLEVIPFFDIVPTYILEVLYAWYKTHEHNKQFQPTRAEQPSLPDRLVLEEKKPWFWKTLFGLLFVGLLLFLAYTYMVPNFWSGIEASVDPDSPMGKAVLSFGKIPLFFKNVVNNIVDSFKAFTERSIAAATGDYFTGQVDANAKEKLGVYLENLKPASEAFYQDEPVTVWGDLYAKTLDTEKTLAVRLQCYLEDDQTTHGSMDPSFIPEIVTQEQEDLRCEFGRGKIDVGSEEVTFAARFNFTTHGYTKAYFMDEERMRSLQREEIDPLDFYQVPDKNPVAIYTNGPVMIGMDARQSLVGLKEGEDTKFRLGITIENLWNGVIQSIHSLTLTIPESMRLVDCDENKPFLKASCQEGECEYKLAVKRSQGEQQGLCQQECQEFTGGEKEACYTACIKRPATGTRFGEIKRFETFQCRVLIPAANKQAVLANVPLATQYFKVIADYDYELYEKTTVAIKRAVGFNVYVTPTEPSLWDIQNGNLKCTGMHAEMDVPSVTYQFNKIAENGEKISLLSAPSLGMVCKERRKCEVTLRQTVSLGEPLKKGNEIECMMTNVLPAGELPPSLQARIEMECGVRCAHLAEKAEGEQYNQCKDGCRANLREEMTASEFTGADIATIKNSEPRLSFKLPKTAFQKSETATMAITVNDPDLEDSLSIGIQFENYNQEPHTIRDLSCQKQQEQVCTTTLSVPVDGAQENQFKVMLTPTDGSTVGRTQIATIAIQEAKP
ncbi:hypothetical protein HYS48_01530 [Candidatus Woesearchaeota archaeon]|nr:hypothetical protein [Candidatus Woesearchaeota archaeon]